MGGIHHQHMDGFITVYLHYIQNNWPEMFPKVSCRDAAGVMRSRVRQAALAIRVENSQSSKGIDN